jgi:hypothetical protein
MHDPNYEHSTRLSSRSDVDRRAISLVGNLLLTGMWLERRITRTLTPRSAAHETSSLRAPPGPTVLSGIMRLSPIRSEEA